MLGAVPCSSALCLLYLKIITELSGFRSVRGSICQIISLSHEFKPGRLQWTNTQINRQTMSFINIDIAVDVTAIQREFLLPMAVYLMLCIIGPLLDVQQKRGTFKNPESHDGCLRVCFSVGLSVF